MTPTLPVKKIAKPELTQGEQTYRQLRSMIVNCELHPGSTVSEPELTFLLGKGKAAVRAALLRLAHDGFVFAVPRHGYRVAPLEVKDAIDLTQLRLLTEPLAYRLATGRIDPAAIESAIKLYVAGYDAKNPKSVTRFMTKNREFKIEIARASGNDRLAAWVEEVSERIDRYLRVSSSLFDLSPVMEENALPLCLALRDGDAKEAERLAEKNIYAITAKILSSLFHNGLAETVGAPIFAFNEEAVVAMLGRTRETPKNTE